jgi:hypothetical protein
VTDFLFWLAKLLMKVGVGTAFRGGPPSRNLRSCAIINSPFSATLPFLAGENHERSNTPAGNRHRWCFLALQRLFLLLCQ